MSDHDQLERRLRATRPSFDEVTIAPDAWQENQRRLAAGRSPRNRRWLAAAAAVVGVLLVGGLLAVGDRGPDAGPPASGGQEDPWDPGNLLGPSVMAEEVTVDGETLDHEIALTDMTGQGPILCDRLVAESSASGSCTAREPGADKPGVAFDWLSGSEGGGSLRGVLAGVDERVAFVDVWMSDGERVAADLHPTGWERTQMFALTVPADGPRPQRLVATGRDANVLQTVDLATSFGDTWLTVRSACAGDTVADVVPPSGLPNANVALGTLDARISVRLSGDDISEACVQPLRSTALGGWYASGTVVGVVTAPEVATVRLSSAAQSGEDSVLDEVTPKSVPGSPWRVAVLRAAKQSRADSAELLAFDAHGELLDRVFVNQPASP